MLKKITLLVNYNLYESKRHFTKKLAEAFERQNVKAHIVDVQESALNSSAISNIMRQQPEMTCSFNAILPLKKDHYLWDELEIPHLSMLVDPAIYSLDLVKSPYSIISCVDRFDCKMMTKQGAKNVLFFPHAIERELSGDLQSVRPYDIVFFGSCYDIEAIRLKWQAHYPKEVGEVIEEAANITLRDVETPFVEAFIQAWNKTGKDFSGLNMPEILTFLDFYSRGKDRIELIKSIKNRNVHVFGDVQMGEHGWKDYLKGLPNVILHEPVSFDESLEILKKSKICLNSMPFFKNGSHERISASLACGAVPITTENLFVKEYFVNGRELLPIKMEMGCFECRYRKVISGRG